MAKSKCVLYSHDPVVEDATGLIVVQVGVSHGSSDAHCGSHVRTQCLVQPAHVHVLQHTRLQNSKTRKCITAF